MATSVASVTLALFVLGAAGAPLYPIAQAQGFAACAHHPALVGAAAQLFAPLEVGLPWLAGTLADVATLPVALAALALQPAALLVLAMHRWPRR